MSKANTSGAKAGGLIEGLCVRHDGWTPARQRAFLRALSVTGCVRDACARAGISNTSAYRARKKSAAFARAWERSLAKAAPTIEQAAYERAVLGWEEPIVQGGKVVGVKRRYSDSLLRMLLQRHVAGRGWVEGNPMPPPLSANQPVLDGTAARAAAAAGGFYASRADLEAEHEEQMKARAEVMRRLDRIAAAEGMTAFDD
jgi:hypothetical protein